MSPTLQSSLRTLRRRVAQGAYLGALSRHVLVASMVGGSLALLLRLTAGLGTAQAALALGLVALAPVSAWLVARRRFLSERGAATWLDLRGGASGALVTELEVADARWSARAAEALARAGDAPGLRGGPIVGRVALGAAFAALALLVPVPASAAGPPRAVYTASVEALREKLETLEEELDLDDETRAELEDRLERLEAEARDAANPEAVFEALAELGERLEAEAVEAQESVEQAAQDLADAARAADADAEAAQRDLAEALEKLAQEGLTLAPSDELARELGLELGPEGLELPEGMKLDPAALEALSKELLEKLAEKLQKLADAGLLDLPPMKGLGNFDLGELGELSLAELADLELCEDCKKGEP